MRPIDLVKKVCPHARAEYLAAFANGDALFERYKVNTDKRLLMFIAQTIAETGDLSVTWENMNYSAPRLLEIFGIGHHSARVTEAEAQQLAHHPEAIAERVYGLGNPSKAKELGNTKHGDGWIYRGGGIMQTTGRYNYRTMGTLCGVDFENHPELVLSAEHALKPALAEWNKSNCNKYADVGDLLSVSRIINLGNAQTQKIPNGMANRTDALKRLSAALAYAHLELKIIKATPVPPLPSPVEPTPAPAVVLPDPVPQVTPAPVKLTFWQNLARLFWKG